jgi:hypothetical protein
MPLLWCAACGFYGPVSAYPIPASWGAWDSLWHHRRHDYTCPAFVGHR